MELIQRKSMVGSIRVSVNLVHICLYSSESLTIFNLILVKCNAFLHLGTTVLLRSFRKLFFFFFFFFFFLLGSLRRSKFANFCHDLMQNHLFQDG